MKATDIPTKMPTVWASEAGSPYIRVVPIAPPAQTGAASFEQGFPPPNFEPIEAGGVPPFGQDANGLNNVVTAWLRWSQAGGGIPFYDGTFAALVGGYFEGAMLQSTSGPGNFWISTADDNETDPDDAGTAANWQAFPGPALVYPSKIQKTNTTFNFNCQTDYSLGLLRSAPAAMTVNLAGAGSLLLNQVFEVADLSGNMNSGYVTVVPPGVSVAAPNGHVIAGAANFVMTNNRQKCRFKYYGVDTGTGYWDVEIGG